MRAGLASRRRTAVFATLMLAAARCAADGGANERRNAFNDPFFQMAAGIAGCPLPAGPYITDEERRLQSHNRAERGTTCWLAGQCERPKFYDYDAEIAAALQAALLERNPFASATLWATVQGRIVFIEGCVADEADATPLESYVMATPNVTRAIAIVHVLGTRKPPYKLRTAP